MIWWNSSFNEINPDEITYFLAYIYNKAIHHIISSDFLFIRLYLKLEIYWKRTTSYHISEWWNHYDYYCENSVLGDFPMPSPIFFRWEWEERGCAYKWVPCAEVVQHTKSSWISSNFLQNLFYWNAIRTYFGRSTLISRFNYLKKDVFMN